MPMRARLPGAAMSRLRKVLVALVLVALATAGLKTRATTAATLAQSLPADVSRLQLRVGIARAGGGWAVTTIPLEIYVGRVLAGEAARDSPPAALEALAITVRTFTLANRGRHRADGFDLCDQTHCQVLRAATAATERAATATAGLVLLRGGVPASVYYSASCGGQTEIPSAVWPGAEDPPFLPSRPDDACGGGPVWTAEIGELDLVRALRAAGFRGDRLRDVRIVAHDGSGRVARLRIDGLEPVEISGQDLRVVVGRTLGWQHIMSAAFEVRRLGHAYRFTGRGAGHGVGLCVIGSVGLAAAGKDAADILDRYFPGLEIGSPGSNTPVSALEAFSTAGARPRAPVGPATAVVVPEVLVSLPDEDEGEQGRIVDLTRRARDELARELDAAAPARVTLRFHPTTDSYERATGQAWFTAGAVANGELHLLPLTILRDRGVLERTIRHELVRVMTDTALAGRPLWVREGAAIYFADRGARPPGVKGDRSIPGEADAPTFRPLPRASCPADAELHRPVSAGALTNAYARARACFARQIAAGKAWRDVK